MIIPQGKLVVLTAGHYDEHGVQGVAIARCDIDTEQCVKDFLADSDLRHLDRYGARAADNYIRWMVAHGWFIACPVDSYTSYFVGADNELSRSGER